MDTDYQADRAWLLDTQRKLYTWAKTKPADAYRDMWNWVSDPRNLRLAWRRVANNRGARSAGVDRARARCVRNDLMPADCVWALAADRRASS